MSGMKFRLQCSSCGSVFFATDRKARYCQKCIKRRPAKPALDQARAGSRPGTSPAQMAAKPSRQPVAAAKPVAATKPRKKELEKKPPKANQLTPELHERIKQIYQNEYLGKDVPRAELVQQISDNIWLKRSIVSAMVQRIEQPEVEITPEMKSRIIELYEGYVRKGERPENGRRKTISQMLNLPYHQVKDIVYKWSLSQYEMAPTHDLTREQKFGMEKIFWDELQKTRYRWNELPEKIAEQVGFATSYQVARWLDMLYDDDHKFESVEDIPEEIASRVREEYLQYLAAGKPPELGLHTTLAQQIGGGITARQVHKVLHNYRKELRAAYPLK